MKAQRSQNLTELERVALTARINLADGHARHSLQRRTRTTLRAIFARTLRSGITDIAEVERSFLTALSVRTAEQYNAHPTYILYSASIALDVVAKYLSSAGLRTGLIVPTFDNIPALLRMAGVEVVPLTETMLMPTCDFEYLESSKVQAILVVMPNNPTGAIWDRSECALLFDWATRHRVLLILDQSFRMSESEACWDTLSLAESIGTSLITIDDTGKVISLHDIKVGVLATTDDVGQEIGRLQSEILLNASSLSLRLLTAILLGSGAGPDEINIGRHLVRLNRAYLRSAISGIGEIETFLKDSSVNVDSSFSVEWLFLGPRQPAILRQCRERGLDVLAGDRFYWNSAALGGGETQWIRIALLRDSTYFQRGVQTFSHVLADLY